MTISKNKLRSGVLALALAAVIGLIPALSAHAETPNRFDPNAGAEYETIQTPKDESMADYVLTLDMLTESEKKQLVDESIAAQPFYDRISGLNEQIDAITNRILQGADALFSERGVIYGAHEALWTKLWDNQNDEQKKLEDYTAIIKASTALTAAEKELLLKDQARLDVLHEEIDKYYAQAEEATKDLTAQRDQAIAGLQELYAKSAHIWAKVYGE